MIFKKDKRLAIELLSDEELVQSIVSGQDGEKIRLFQEELYKRFSGKVFAKCIQMVKNREIAKDLAHDVFIKIFLKLNTFKGKSAFYSWVYAVTYNHCISYLEKNKKIQVVNYEDHDFDVASDENELELKILQDLKLSQLEILLDRIDEKEKLILLMRYQDGLSIKEMSDIIGITGSAVKMRLKRSRDHLANLLKELDHDK